MRCINWQERLVKSGKAAVHFAQKTLRSQMNIPLADRVIQQSSFDLLRQAARRCRKTKDWVWFNNICHESAMRELLHAWDTGNTAMVEEFMEAIRNMPSPPKNAGKLVP